MLIAAARRWRVPLWALVGVKLAETGTAASAPNPFQFEPGTARSVGVRDVNSFSESANGAAKLLASYKHRFGSWNAAFEAYNGGPGAVGGGYAYNESHIVSKLAEVGLSKAQLGGSGRRSVSLLGGLKGTLDKAFGWALGGVAGGEAAGEALHKESLGKLGESVIGNPLEGIAGVISTIFSAAFWLRVLEMLGGAVLLYLGLKTLTGVSASELPGAGLAKHAPIPVPV